MKKVLIAALLALSFTTGFTCSKNAPEQGQDQPAAPADAAAQPTSTEPAPPAEQPAPPAEGSGN